MIKTKVDECGDRYVEATLTLTIKGYLLPGEGFEEVTEEVAEYIIMGELWELAGSNTGSELLLNTKPVIKNE